MSRANHLQMVQPARTRFNDNGTIKMLVPYRGTVVGPASYAAGGFPVDLSATFSSIVAVQWVRTYTTATLVSVPRGPAVANETGTDVFSSAKFRLLIYRTATHTHTYDKHDANTSTLGAGSTYTSTASGNQSLSVFDELAATTNESTRTYEFIAWGVPV